MSEETTQERNGAGRKAIKKELEERKSGRKGGGR